MGRNADCRNAVLVYPSFLTIPLDVIVGDIRVQSPTFAPEGDMDKAWAWSARVGRATS